MDQVNYGWLLDLLSQKEIHYNAVHAAWNSTGASQVDVNQYDFYFVNLWVMDAREILKSRPPKSQLARITDIDGNQSLIEWRAGAFPTATIPTLQDAGITPIGIGDSRVPDGQIWSGESHHRVPMEIKSVVCEKLEFFSGCYYQYSGWGISLNY
jgi:hypothetical protein